jgi:bifunctional non-homologous end joining protein LigD
MQLNGDDLRAVALADRKRRLGHLIERAGIARLRHSETFEDGERLLAECDRRGLEGVVAKHKNGIYRSGRSTSWVKVKCSAWRASGALGTRNLIAGRAPLWVAMTESAISFAVNMF